MLASAFFMAVPVETTIGFHLVSAAVRGDVTNPAAGCDGLADAAGVAWRRGDEFAPLPARRAAGGVGGPSGHVDGGGAADPGRPLDAWLVCDERAELMPQIRRRARELEVRPAVASFAADGVVMRPLPVRHTSHPTVGYLIKTASQQAVWAPEFWVFPDWAARSERTLSPPATRVRPRLLIVGLSIVVLTVAVDGGETGVATGMNAIARTVGSSTAEPLSRSCSAGRGFWRKVVSSRSSARAR